MLIGYTPVQNTKFKKLKKKKILPSKCYSFV